MCYVYDKYVHQPYMIKEAIIIAIRYWKTCVLQKCNLVVDRKKAVYIFEFAISVYTHINLMLILRHDIH